MFKNYWPVLLLLLSSEMFGHLTCNNRFFFLKKNDLISQKQSGLKFDDSCVNQLQAITLEIYSRFDNSYDVSRAFLHVSKAFDKYEMMLLFKISSVVKFQGIQ